MYQLSQEISSVIICHILKITWCHRTSEVTFWEQRGGKKEIVFPRQRTLLFQSESVQWFSQLVNKSVTWELAIKCPTDQS